MERRRNSISEHLGSVVLHTEDLRAIVEVLGESGSKVAIETESHSFETLDELTSSSDSPLHTLTLSVRDPYVSLDLKPNGIWLYASDNTPIQRGLYEKLKAILRSRRRRVLPVLTNSPTWGVTLGLVIAWLLNTAWSKKDPRYLLGAIPLVGLGSLWIWAGWRLGFHAFSTIHLSPRASRPGFLARRRDDIALAVISAVIGSLLTLLLAKLAGGR